MGKPGAFLKIGRQTGEYRPVCERVKDYRDISVKRPLSQSKEQASRCMDCGTPFCHWGCPIGNYIPEWNDLMFMGRWKKAFELLEATNSMPEITGRLCPAICEHACVLGINDDPVTIRENELVVAEEAFKKGFIKPRPPKERNGRKVAIIGSGPAGLSCAARLNRAGHSVTVFEKDDKIGGILRYGIPDFKLGKWILDRRIKIWEKEGIEFKTCLEIGKDYPMSKLTEEFDAVCLAGGSRTPRDLKIKGRELDGIHFAMDYLTQSNKRVAGEKVAKDKLIDAKDKKVVVIGGGDTGADCVGTAHRQGAACVVQIEILPQPPECRTKECPWPQYPMLLKTSSSHEEGGQRHWSVMTKEFVGERGYVRKLVCVRKDDPDNEFEIEADLVILAIGFVNPEGNVKTDTNYMTSTKGVFCAGDMRRGQSLIVWAIYEGQQAANSINKYLLTL